MLSEQCHSINTDRVLKQGIRYGLFPSTNSEPNSAIVAVSGNSRAVRAPK